LREKCPEIRGEKKKAKKKIFMYSKTKGGKLRMFSL